MQEKHGTYVHIENPGFNGMLIAVSPKYGPHCWKQLGDSPAYSVH